MQKYYLIRAEILLPGNNAFRDSCAGPFLGFVQKYKILREIYTSSLLKKHQILVQKTGYGFGGYPPSPPLGIFFQRKGGYGFGGYPLFPPLRTKSSK